MRIILLLSILFLAVLEINCQSNTRVTPADTSDHQIIHDIPVSNFNFNFSTLPGQPMLNGSMNNLFGNTGKRYSDIKGSPYLNPDFVDGTVTLINGKHFDKAPLQFDMYSKNIIAKVEGDKHIALNKALYKSFIIPHDGKDLLFKKVNNENPKDFFVVLFENEDFIFFKDMYVTFRDETNKGMTTVEAKFINRNDYYITEKGMGQTSKVKLKKKDIVNHLPRKMGNAILIYADKNNVTLKNEDDIVKALESITE